MKHTTKKGHFTKKKLLFLIVFLAMLLSFGLVYRSRSHPTNHLLSEKDIQHQWAFEKMDIQQAWRVSTGKGVKIAIIDSGFDLDNSGISDKIVGVDYYRSGENGPEDTIGHGTQTSSVITGPAGVCPDCQLIVVKLGQGDSNLKIAQTIRWAVDKGANVINLSFVTRGYDPYIQQEIYRAWEKGVVLIAAAGNENTSTLAYPAGYGPVIAVGATDRNDQKASFSNYGDWVDLAAPGIEIFTSLERGRFGLSSGTSISSPLVAGIAGLVWSSKYGTSNESVVKRLCDTADKTNDSPKYWKCGRINAARAVGAIH